jgi:glycogen debranching enzyme
MDAKRDGVVFTPRHGKAVEINALWYNALVSVAELVAPTMKTQAAELSALAQRVKDSFRAQFFDPRRGCLFDVLTPAGHGKWRAVPEIRPNQIFAVALTHSALTPEQQKSVVACVRSKLLTPVGLRTLDPADPRYVGRFEGDLFHRDGAYHNGTVWPWLIGPFIEASLRAENFSEASRAQAMRDLSGLIGLVRGLPAPKESSGPARSGVPRSVGTIAEVFDGDEPAPDSPRRADGCMAQAWSVAECLRALSLIRSAGKDRAPTSSPAATATSGPAIESKAPAGKPVRT